MTTILHGDNTVQIHVQLVELIQKAKQENIAITRLEAKQLTLPKLEETIGSKDLFGTKQLTIIEGLHSLPRSKKKTALIEQIQQAKTDIVLLEIKKLTATQLKKFPQSKTMLFKLNNALFKWLDHFTPKTDTKKNLQLLHQAIKADSDMMCFIMLARQIRLLIQAKDGGKIKGAPFMITKLKNQAYNFSLPQLLKLHQKLLDIDLEQKTSQNQLNLAAQLDLLILNM